MKLSRVVTSVSQLRGTCGIINVVIERVYRGGKPSEPLGLDWFPATELITIRSCAIVVHNVVNRPHSRTFLQHVPSTFPTVAASWFVATAGT